MKDLKEHRDRIHAKVIEKSHTILPSQRVVKQKETCNSRHLSIQGALKVPTEISSIRRHFQLYGRREASGNFTQGNIQSQYREAKVNFEKAEADFDPEDLPSPPAP